MSNIFRVQWTITPQIAPRPWLNCNRCGDARPFRSSDKIRMNANGRRVDAWLIYKCMGCENSWNRPLLERKGIGDIDPSTLHALQSNDADLVRRAAFDVEDLRRGTERVEEFSEIKIVRKMLSMGQEPLARLEISLAVPVPTTGLRADRLLAGELGVSRPRVRAWQAKGRLRLFPYGARMLRRPVTDGMYVSIDILRRAATSMCEGCSMALKQGRRLERRFSHERSGEG
jgi:hypothetical protein